MKKMMKMLLVVIMLMIMTGCASAKTGESRPAHGLQERDRYVITDDGILWKDCWNRDDLEVTTGVTGFADSFGYQVMSSIDCVAFVKGGEVYAGNENSMLLVRSAAADTTIDNGCLVWTISDCVTVRYCLSDELWGRYNDGATVKQIEDAVFSLLEE